MMPGLLVSFGLNGMKYITLLELTARRRNLRIWVLAECFFLRWHQVNRGNLIWEIL